MKKLLIALILLSGPSVWAANGFVQGNGHLQATASLTNAVTLTGTTSGNLLVFVAGSKTSTATDSLPTDGHNTWTLIRSADANGAFRQYSWYAVNNFTGTLTVTGNFSSTVVSYVFIHEYSGLGANPTAHAGTFASATSTAGDSGATATSSGDLLIGYVGNNGANDTITAGAGYTQPAGAAGILNGQSGFEGIEYNLSSAGGSTHATATISTSVLWGMAEIAFTPTVIPLGSKIVGPSNLVGPSVRR